MKTLPPWREYSKTLNITTRHSENKLSFDGRPTALSKTGRRGIHPKPTDQIWGLGGRRRPQIWAVGFGCIPHLYPVFDSAVSESRTRKTEVTSSNEITIGCGAAESGCGCGRTAGRRSVYISSSIARCQ